MAFSDLNKTNTHSEKPVQQRLLDTAEVLFSEHGFEGTSVRELANTASCNLASVNYYFGGKDKLYLEVWRRRLKLLRETRIASIKSAMSKGDGQVQLEELLRSYANSFIEPLADESKSRHLIRLMAREIIDPHLPRDMFLTEMVKPVMAVLEHALVQACPKLDHRKVPLVIISIVGQLMHIMRVKTMFEQAKNLGLPKFDLSEVLEHIVRFSAAGIRACAEQKKE